MTERPAWLVNRIADLILERRCCGHSTNRANEMTYTNSVDRVAMMELRQAQARRMRSTGMTYAAIGRELGLSESTVHDYLAGYNQPQPTSERTKGNAEYVKAMRAMRPDEDPHAWVTFAVCRQQANKDICFPETPNPKQWQAAKDLCKVCPVVEECLTFALAHREKDGVWGGLTYTERKSLLRKQRRAA